MIHTVGPVWYGGNHGEAGLLVSCYRRCMEVAEANGLRSVAFPAISTGAYGFPKGPAAEIAVATVRDWTTGHDLPETVVFCCFDEATATRYRRLLAEI